ncbi:MAG: hypothetical protein HYR86_09530, partial [Candidatus Rokubacteria bacterium]|nr:hypothetical protein [Candidatus Rokubacteria bacterium]
MRGATAARLARSARARRGALLALALGAGLLLGPAPGNAATTRYVNGTGTCGGQTPCYATIAAALSATQRGDTIQVQSQVAPYAGFTVTKNLAGTPQPTEADRITIQADPAAAPGTVVVAGAGTTCAQQTVSILVSNYITLRGLTITGGVGPAITIGGTSTAPPSRSGAPARPGGFASSAIASTPSARPAVAPSPSPPPLDATEPSVLTNNVIYAARDAGITILPGASPAGKLYLVGNTIHANAGHGVWVYRPSASSPPVPEVFLVNNALTNNGAAPGAGYGVNVGALVQAGMVHLKHTLLCGNSLGELTATALDSQAAGNLTPTGTEGAGVSAWPGCQTPATVYANITGADGVANTADDDVTPTAAGPLVDHGLDPTTLGLTTDLNAIFQSDFLGPAHRPAYGLPTGALAYDMGAIEWRDTTAPTLAFLQPAANAWVRQTVTVQAQATDSGSGVATLTLIAGASTLSTSLSPPPPAASVTGTAAWATTTFPDGATTLTAQATDRAGTAPAPVTRVVLIDNTAPDTQITAGPVGTIADPTVTFIFTGTDNLTPVGNLVFAWRLDGGAWSAFSGTTSATLTNVAVGAHTFDVKARDLAGNEDATPATRSFTVSFIPAITGLTPASGRIGTPVTITGLAFGFTPIAVAFNGTPAVIQSRTATAITTTAPPGMTSGLVSVTTPYGTATSPSPFTLVTEDFSLAIAPAATQVLQGSTTSFTVTPTGTANLTSAVALTVGGLPSGVTGTFAPPTVAPGQAAALVLTTTSSAALGTATFTVTATTTTDGSVVTHTATGSLTVVAAGQTALVGRVLDTNGVPLQNVAIRIGSTFVSTDAGGNFLFLNPPTGSQVVLIDGDPASPSADQHYPTIPVTVTIVANQTNPLPFVPYLHVQQNYNFTRIDPGTDTVATDPALPGVQLTIDATNSI